MTSSIASNDGFHNISQGTDNFTWISSPTNEYVVESLPCAYLGVS